MEAQEDQILAIYPVLPGQTSKRDSVIPQIPARKSLETAPSGAAGAADVAAAPVAAAPAAASGDLIDFGDNAESSPAAAQPVENSAPVADNSSNEIADMLSSTGKLAPSGPLMDFSKDLDKNLPTIKRSDTSGSQDVFHDAEN